MVSRSHPYSSCDLTKAQYRGFSVETSLKSLQFLFIKLYSPCWKSHYQNKTPSIIISKSLTKFAYCFQLLQVRKTASLVCIWNDPFRVEEMESITSLTSDVVVFLYLVFLVLSVIMLVNILVALLTTTYDRYKVRVNE